MINSSESPILPRSNINRKINSIVLILLIAVFSLVILCFARLIPLGNWIGDEFYTFLSFNQYGWGGFWYRLINWSPRPLSELLIFTYSQFVQYYKTPLIKEFLIVLWIGFAVSMIAMPILAVRSVRSKILKLQVAALSLSLFCLMLVGHRIGEMFYWPQGAVAYMPAISGLLISMWVMTFFDMNSRIFQLICSVGLSVVALSVEVGAFLVFVFSCFIVIPYSINKISGKALIDLTTTGKSQHNKNIVWIIPPFIFSFVVLVMLFIFRIGKGVVFGDAAIAHQIIPSIIIGSKAFWAQIISIHEFSIQDVAALNLYIILGLITKIFFFLASCCILGRFFVITQRRISLRLLLALGLACFITVYFSIVLAYYQFGLMCCERHDTFRQCLIFIGIICVAGIVARLNISFFSKVRAIKVYLMLFIAVLIPTVLSMPRVINEYKNYDITKNIRNINWESGRSSDKNMTFYILPNIGVISEVDYPEQTFYLDSPDLRSIVSTMKYFNKESLIIKSVNITEAVKPINSPDEYMLTPIKHQETNCNIDIVNDKDYKNGDLIKRGPFGALSLVGWSAVPQSAESSSMKTIIVATSLDGKKTYFNTQSKQRDDLVTAFNRPKLKDSGFKAVIDLNGLTKSQSISLLAVSNNKAYECNNINIKE